VTSSSMHHVSSVDVDKPNHGACWIMRATLAMAVVVVVAVAEAVAVAIAVDVTVMLAVMVAQCTTRLQGRSMVAALALM